MGLWPIDTERASGSTDDPTQDVHDADGSQVVVATEVELVLEEDH